MKTDAVMDKNLEYSPRQLKRMAREAAETNGMKYVRWKLTVGTLSTWLVVVTASKVDGYIKEIKVLL